MRNLPIPGLKLTTLFKNDVMLKVVENCWSHISQELLINPGNPKLFSYGQVSNSMLFGDPCINEKSTNLKVKAKYLIYKWFYVENVRLLISPT